MSEILLVNPRRRKSRKTRSAAQKRATAKMLAANRARRGGSKRRKARRSNPAPLTAVMHNPRRRRVSARRRRNPISLRRMVSGDASLAPIKLISLALIGAAGATAVNTIMARLPIPVTFMTGRTRYLTNAAAAIVIGIIASKVKIVGAASAAKMAEGSLTVTLHDAIKDFAAGFGMNLGGMGYYLPGRGVQAVPSASGSPAPRLGEYMTGPGSPASVVQMPRRGMAGAGFGFGR